MDWSAQVNSYCERVDFTFWSEPLNAVTNAAFIIAALWAWRMAQGDRGGRVLAGILLVIGVGSFLFHTLATRWAAVADTTPILVFILTYLYLATTRYFRLPWWAGALAAVLFVPYSMAVGWVLTPLVGNLNGSMGYVPVPILVAVYGLLLLRKRPETGRGMLVGAGILTVSLVFRSVDQAVCGTWPWGTHFMWHLLNGTMLGWMIFVFVRDGKLRR